jgi:hypothetical protein
VLGLGFDALKRREQQRRHRQLFAITCAALAGMVLTSGLAAVALIARALRSAKPARGGRGGDGQADHELSRRSLPDFDPSEARGNSVTAREMLTRAARIDTELARRPAVRPR